MNFLINETQLKFILENKDKSNIEDSMKILYSFTNDIVNKAKKDYKLNLKLLLTWGASVGGLLMPLDEFIKSGRFNLTDNQKTLILIGIACSYFFDNEKLLKSIIIKIKEEGIEKSFKEVLIKSKNLKESFYNFLSSLDNTIGGMIDIIGYSFLVPIITDIQDMVANTSNINETSLLITERLIASGVVIVGSKALSKIVKKIVKKFK